MACLVEGVDGPEDGALVGGGKRLDLLQAPAEAGGLHGRKLASG